MSPLMQEVENFEQSSLSLEFIEGELLVLQSSSLRYLFGGIGGIDELQYHSQITPWILTSKILIPNLILTLNA